MRFTAGRKFPWDRLKREWYRPALFLPLVLCIGCKTRFAPLYSETIQFFGTEVTINLTAETHEEGEALLKFALAEVKRLEHKLNPLSPTGPLYMLNEERVTQDAELYAILERGMQAQELTGGRFNLFMGDFEAAFKFGQQVPQIPDSQMVTGLILALRRAKMELKPEIWESRISEDAFSVSLTGVREGYAADQVVSRLTFLGVRNASVKIGEFMACGGSPDDLGWPVDIVDPATNERVLRLYLEDRGVATASIRDQAFHYRNRLYHNHIDPTSGYPAHRIRSVTVVAPSCELAAELSRGIFIMPPEEGIELLNSLGEVEGSIIGNDGELYTSDSLSFHQIFRDL